MVVPVNSKLKICRPMIFYWYWWPIYWIYVMDCWFKVEGYENVILCEDL